MDYERILEKQLENVLEGEDFSGITEETSRLSEGLSDPFTLENILRATLEQKSLFPEMLDGALSGISVKFGEEDGTFAISNSTVVSANYYKDGKPAGTLGIIGPMRLDYRKVIPYIEYLSKKVTRLLSESEHLQIESEEIDDNDE